MHATLHEDLHLSKKSARWVPKLLNPGNEKKEVRICGKAKGHATWTKKMVLAFFDSKGLIYTNLLYAIYIVEALGKFLKIFKQKRLEMAAREWWFH